MAIDEKKVEEYISDLRKKFAESPKKLEPFERRMIGRYEEALAASNQADQDVRALRQQINQANARIGSLEVQYADLQGKSAGYIESLIARKFEDDFDDDGLGPLKAGTEKPVKKPVNRAAKRAANKKASKTRSRSNSKSTPSST